MLSNSPEQQGEQSHTQAAPLQTAVGQMPVSAADASAAVTGPQAYRPGVPPVEENKVRQLVKDEQENLRGRYAQAEEVDKKVC